MTERFPGVASSGMVSLGDAQRTIATGLSEDIVSSATFARLLEISDRLPLTTGAGLECHLHDASRVDLSVRITAQDWERGGLAGTHAACSYPDVFFVHPAWERLRQFARNWQDNGRLISSRIRYCWLEFDTDLPNALAVPNIFFDSGEKLWRMGGTLPEPEGQEEIAWICETAALLMGEALGNQIRDHLWHCYMVLPPQVSFRYIGVMPGRRSNSLRLTLSGFTPDQLEPYLQKLGWRGTLAPIIHLLDLPGVRIALHVDIGQQPGPTLGYEVTFANIHDEQRSWQQLLEGFMLCGICRPSVWPALLAWPGISDADIMPTGWSPRLRRLTRRIVRRVNHFKVTQSHDGTLRAKVYLYFGLLDTKCPSGT